MLEFFNRYFYIFKFFTTWNIIFVLLHAYTHQIVNLLYLSYVTLMIGLYLSFVNPKKFVFKFGDKKYVFDKWSKFLSVDVLFHICVFLFVFYCYSVYYLKYGDDSQLLLSILIIFFYISMINVKKVYGVDFIEFVVVFCVVNILYFILF